MFAYRDVKKRKKEKKKERKKENKRNRPRFAITLSTYKRSYSYYFLLRILFPPALATAKTLYIHAQLLIFLVEKSQKKKKKKVERKEETVRKKEKNPERSTENI